MTAMATPPGAEIQYGRPKCFISRPVPYAPMPYIAAFARASCPANPMSRLSPSERMT